MSLITSIAFQICVPQFWSGRQSLCRSFSFISSFTGVGYREQITTIFEHNFEWFLGCSCVSRRHLYLMMIYQIKVTSDAIFLVESSMDGKFFAFTRKIRHPKWHQTFPPLGFLLVLIFRVKMFITACWSWIVISTVLMVLKMLSKTLINWYPHNSDCWNVLGKWRI